MKLKRISPCYRCKHGTIQSCPRRDIKGCGKLDRFERTSEKIKTKKTEESLYNRLLKKAKELCHTYIKLRDIKAYNGLCPTCTYYGRTPEPIFSANHVFKQSNNPGTRYDEMAIYGGCKKCNTQENWDPAPVIKWAVDRLGPYGYDDIYDKRKKSEPYTIFELEDIIIYYQKKIEEFTA